MKKLYKYPSLSVFPVMDFSIFAISPFTWNTKHVCYHLQNFIKIQFQIEKKLKTKSCFLYKKILQIDYYLCAGKFCEVHKSLFIANITWRKLPIASPQLSLVYHFQTIYILIIKKKLLWWSLSLVICEIKSSLLKTVFKKNYCNVELWQQGRVLMYSLLSTNLRVHTHKYWHTSFLSKYCWWYQ